MMRLNNLAVVITRPRHQAKPLCQAVLAEGGKPIEFPTLEIAALDDPSLLLEALETLQTYQIAIFVSPNAVDYVMAAIVKKSLPIPDTLAFFAVGPGTQKALARWGIEHSICPREQFNSEGLLAEPQLQLVKDKKIIIFTGQGGRELLQTTLIQRGAKVSKVASYQRQCPEQSATSLLEKWRHKQINIIVSTSIESLQNFLRLIGEEGRELLRVTPLLVVSERMAEFAREHHVSKHIVVAKSAQEDRLLESLIQWYEEKRYV